MRTVIQIDTNCERQLMLSYTCVNRDAGGTRIYQSI